MKFRIQFAEQVVGFFVILAFFFLALIMILMGVNQRWFKKNYYFESRFPSSSGISTGMDIRYKGFKVGKLTTIRMSEEGEALIKFYIFDDYIDRVNQYSMLELESNPLLGGTLQFRPGLVKTEHITENSFIPSASIPEGKEIIRLGLAERPKSDDSISKILENVNSLLEGINGLMPKADSLAAGLSSGENSSEVARIIIGLANSIENLNLVLGNVAELTNELKDPTGLAVKLIDPKGSLKTLLDDDNVLFDEIIEMVNKTQLIFDQLNKTMAEVESLTSFLASKRPDIAIMLQDTQRAIKQGNDVLEGISNNPLLKGGITKEKTQTGTTQGNRDGDF